MNGIGVIVNVLAALVGGGFGLMFRGKMRVQYQKLTYSLLGLGVLGVGAYELIQSYFVMSNGEVELTGSLLVIVALLVGGLMGYLFRIDEILEAVGQRLSRKDEQAKERERNRLERLSRAVDLSIEKGVAPPKVSLLDRLSTYEIPAPLSNNLYADGFVLAVIFLCANSMLLNGVMAESLSGETKILFIKSIADFILCFILSFICGSGPLYAVIPMAVQEVFLWFICLVAPDFTVQFLDQTLTGQLSVIGAVTLLFVGVQMAFDRKKPKAVYLLPSALIPILYYGILFVVNLFIGE